MGEFAIYKDQRIKIGTCEDLGYLRAEQWSLVTPELGNCDEATYLRQSRFRFPWPDEDEIEPGAFSDLDRSYAVHGLRPPDSVKGEHGRVQFTSSRGYMCSLPCPESGVVLDGVRIQHNGYAGAVRLCQQRWWNGVLVGVLRCNGCGIVWRLETQDDAAPVAVALRSEADRLGEQDGHTGWLHTVADRLIAGYEIQWPSAHPDPRANAPE
jgi:hypothetical protein